MSKTEAEAALPTGPTDPASPSAPTPLSRQAIRDQIFGAKPESTKVDLFGAEVEIRQPTLGVALAIRQEDREQAVFRMMLDYTYVPGSDEKVFEATDMDPIAALPMGPSVRGFIDAVNKLLGVSSADVEAAVRDATKSD